MNDWIGVDQLSRHAKCTSRVITVTNLNRSEPFSFWILALKATIWALTRTSLPLDNMLHIKNTKSAQAAGEGHSIEKIASEGACSENSNGRRLN